jgi:hypothetical protein
MLTQDSVSWRVAKLKHKNEAIREVNAKIGIPGRGMSDEVVGTVLTLASFEVCEDLQPVCFGFGFKWREEKLMVCVCRTLWVITTQRNFTSWH